jgi:CheY-like chemotaxis protein
MRIQRRVLCVDDHIDTCRLIATILESEEVVLAHTKADALQKARDGRFNLYLLDYHLPDGTGFELCLLIRVFDSSTPIIFVTSSERLTQSHVTAVGAQALVSKSDLPDGLVSAVSSIFKQVSC